MNPAPQNASSVPIQSVIDAVKSGLISKSSGENIRVWLTSNSYAEYWPQLHTHIREAKWAELEDVFWTTIPFGTAGRRGRMYPIGTNAINDRTIGETVQALAAYVVEIYDGPSPATCAIAYDTRNNSEHFARLCAEIMLAHGFDVLFFNGFRSTPLLATTVRYLQCACGLMVSASHNPPSDNAAKVFWDTGGQLKTPHDEQVTKRLGQVGLLKREPFHEGVASGRVRYVDEAMDRIYRDAVLAEGFGRFQGSRDLSIIYSPMHGVGLTSVTPVLRADGFENVEVFSPHSEPNGDFPNVPDNIANPENPRVFDAMIERAVESGADIILASDPDADRLGCACPIRIGSSEWRPINGNQLAVLLAEYVLRKRKAAGTLSADHFIVKTLVTTDMLTRLGGHYGVTTYGECLTGFKWIGSLVDEHGPDLFLFGAEEAHGYLIGTHARDKDGAVAAMLLAEFAAEAKLAGRSLHEELDLLHLKHGLHLERTIAQKMPGADGMEKMQSIMARLRENMPESIGGMAITSQADYLNGTYRSKSGEEKPLAGPTGNVLIFHTELAGNYLAVRPSGTEPKIKFYLFTSLPPAESGDLDAAREKLLARLESMHKDVVTLSS